MLITKDRMYELHMLSKIIEQHTGKIYIDTETRGLDYEHDNIIGTSITIIPEKIEDLNVEYCGTTINNFDRSIVISGNINGVPSKGLYVTYLPTSAGIFPAVSFYTPFGHFFRRREQLLKQEVINFVKPIADRTDLEKIGHNIKFDARMFHHSMNIDLINMGDTMLLDTLRDETSPHKLKVLADTLLNIKVKEIKDLVKLLMYSKEKISEICKYTKIDPHILLNALVADDYCILENSEYNLEALSINKITNRIRTHPVNSYYKRLLNAIRKFCISDNDLFQAIGTEIGCDANYVKSKIKRGAEDYIFLVDINSAAEYACQDTELTAILDIEYNRGSRDNIRLSDSLVTLYTDIEKPVLESLVGIENEGLPCDRDMLENMLSDISIRLDKLKEDIYDMTGETFNINSTEELGVVLFDIIGLPCLYVDPKTGGRSTNEYVLSTLVKEHPVIDKLLLYREYDKIKGTYLESILNKIWADGKIRPQYWQTGESRDKSGSGTVTGRLSSSKPNAQNIVHHKEFNIRNAIYAPEGYYIVSSDLSQIELVGYGFYAMDYAIIRARKRMEDLHSGRAASIYAVPVHKVTDDMRKIAKTMAFAMLYGAGVGLVAKRLGISYNEAKKVIYDFKKSTPEGEKFTRSVINFVRAKKYVETITGRRRNLSHIDSANDELRNKAERQAINTKIQSTAADICKSIMIGIKKGVKQNGIDAVLVAQIHDDILSIVKKEDIHRYAKLVTSVSKKPHMFDKITDIIPIDMDIKYGERWGSMVKYNEFDQNTSDELVIRMLKGKNMIESCKDPDIKERLKKKFISMTFAYLEKLGENNDTK